MAKSKTGWIRLLNTMGAVVETGIEESKAYHSNESEPETFRRSYVDVWFLGKRERVYGFGPMTAALAMKRILENLGLEV